MRRERGDALARVLVNGQAADLVESLGRINLDNLTEEVQETGAEQIWWGIMAARAERQAAQADFDTKTLRAEKRRQYRADAVNRGEQPGRGGFTNDAIDDAVQLDPAYQSAARKALEAREAAEMVQSAKYAIIQKNDNIGNLAPLLSQERYARAEPPRPSTRPRTPVR